MDKIRPQTIDEYIDNFPPATQIILNKIRETIKKIAPQATEAISYQMPTFKLNGKNLVHFAGYKNHIGFYPTPSGIEKFIQEISTFKTGKGTVQFPLSEPIPYSLIEKIVKYRLEESLKKDS